MQTRGCVVGNYLIVPEHCQQPAAPKSMVELCVNVYILSEPTAVTDELMVLVASYGLPVDVEYVHVSRDRQNTRCGLRGEKARATMLEIRICTSIFWTPARTFIPQIQPATIPIPSIPWQHWAPASLHPGGRLFLSAIPIAMAGMHIVCPPHILDLNKYGASYVSRDDKRDKGKRDRSIHRGLVTAGLSDIRGEEQILKMIGLSLKTGPLYRITKDPFKGCADPPPSHVVYLIEEPDGPKVLVPLMHTFLTLTHSSSW